MISPVAASTVLSGVLSDLTAATYTPGTVLLLVKVMVICLFSVSGVNEFIVGAVRSPSATLTIFPVAVVVFTRSTLTHRASSAPGRSGSTPLIVFVSDILTCADVANGSQVAPEGQE